MSDKDPKLWESTFGDDSDSDEPEQLSRVRQKKNRHGNKLLVWSLFIILLIVMFLPIIGQKLTSNHNKSAIDSVNQETVSTKPKKTVTKHKTKSKKKQKAKKVVSKMDQSQKTEQAASQPADQENNNDSTAANQPQANANAEAAQPSQPAANNNEANNAAQNAAAASSQYYTVQPHDNAYRIALNHGLTTAQLYQLNGMAAGTVLRPGMQLRVK